MRIDVTWGGSLSLAVVAVLGGCAGGEGDGAPGVSDLFCVQATGRVSSYMERARAERMTPFSERYGGTAVVGAIGEISGGMNALAANDYVAVQHQQFVHLMTLISYDERLSPVPYLAESWEVNDSETELTFRLRRDVLWHDGERTDAHDVAFTYLRATDPRTAFPNAGYWDLYVAGQDGVEVLDDFTVRIHLRPHADYMDPWRTVAILPEHLLGEVPPEEILLHPYGTRCPVGNGPFVFLEHRLQDRWVFEANPVFPEELGGRPYLDRLVYRVIPEQATLLTELLTEGIDVYIGPSTEQASRIDDDPDLELRRFASRNYGFIAWNARRPQLADRRVRRAFTLATDRRQIVDALLGGHGRVANSGVPPFHWAYDPQVADTPFDPDEARRLLDEAGWIDRNGDGVRERSDGLRLRVSVKYNQGNQLRQDIAVIMQAQLAAVGAEVRPELVEWSTLLDQIFNPAVRDFDGVVMVWATDFKLDETDLFHSDRIDGPTALAGIRSPTLDRYLDTLRLVTDRAQARRLWLEYQTLLEEEHPYTFVYFPPATAGVNERLRNVVMDARGEWVKVKDWWIEPSARRTR